ncbi:MAG: N-acetyltransferase family protein [Paracoccaceae bacterium]
MTKKTDITTQSACATDDAYAIRSGQVPDAWELAQLHVAVWRETYRAYAPQTAVNELGPRRRLPYWTKALASDPSDTGALVATRNGAIVAVSGFGVSTHPAFAGAAEIKHFYVGKSARGLGLGSRLFRTTLDHLRIGGQNRVALAVVEQNTRARKFYRTLGGEEIGAFTDAGPLWRSSNIVVQWVL